MIKAFFIFLILIIFSVRSAFAISDPTLSANNKFGINSLSPDAELNEVSELVNTNGDWGYIVVTVKKSEQDPERWQNFLNLAREKHIIPIFRIATEFHSDGFWDKPSEEDAEKWADFFSKLYFPTRNKYIQVYNEVNRGSEWGGAVSPQSYADELDKTIAAFKEKSPDFFILNAPLDLSLRTFSDSLEAGEYFRQMNEQVPGIFERLDGLASHSYPNPDFSSPPVSLGRVGIDGYNWELSQIAKYTDKKLPVFITETGWKREEGLKKGLSEDKISQYYEEAFRNIWKDEKVVTVAPFVLGYPEPLFNQFSFKTSNLGQPTFYKYFSTLKNMPKVKGEPARDDIAENTTIQRPSQINPDTQSNIVIKFKNSGNYVWNFRKELAIRFASENLQALSLRYDKEQIYPGEESEVNLKVRSIREGIYPSKIEIVNGDKTLFSTNISILVTQKPSVISQIQKGIKNFVGKVFAQS